MADRTLPTIEVVEVRTPLCGMCMEHGWVTVTLDAWNRYRGGALAQAAFSEMDRAEREQLITGTHPACWQRMLGAS